MIAMRRSAQTGARTKRSARGWRCRRLTSSTFIIERCRRHASQHPGGLTPREIDVLRLVAVGRSNRVIATELFISARTVERHIANIYLKIDAHNKVDAAAWALRHGLA